MRRPSEEQLATLERFERVAFRVADAMNRHEPLKRAAQVYLRRFGAWWVTECTDNLLHVYHDEHLRNLDPDRGVMIAANHRSFFDLYVLSAVVYRTVDWVKRTFYPVRSGYFYERPDGVAVNAIMSAMAMYPPIFRDQKKRSMNQYAIDALADVAAERGTLVGFHPEGTRNKTDDPYTLLPAQPGVGQLIHHANPIVLPVFILGLGNDFVKQVRSNFDGTGEPITVVFGAPVSFEQERNEPPKLRTYKRIADRLRDVLTRLGQEEKAIRAREGFPDLSPPKAPPAPATPDRSTQAA